MESTGRTGTIRDIGEKIVANRTGEKEDLVMLDISIIRDI